MDTHKLQELHDGAKLRAVELRNKIDAADETADLDALEAELDDAIIEVERTKKNLEKRIAQDAVLDAAPIEVPNRKQPAEARGAGRAELVYHPHSEDSFFRDLVNARHGDPRAFERLERNNKEFVAARDVQQRAGLNQTATSAGEFSPPVWMMDMYAAKLRAGRAFTNAVGTNPLPAGTNSLNLPAITTGASTAVQTDGGSVSNTDWVTASITAQVQTIAGRTVASYQIVDLGTAGLEQIIFEDLLAAYNAALDVAVINGNVANAKGFHNVTGINTATYTDASPTVPELYPVLFQGKSAMEKNGFGSPQFVGAHPSTWNWYLSALDSSNRPLALSTDAAAFNATAGFDYAAEGLAGNFNGLPVIVDSNFPVNLGAGTNEAWMAMVNRRGLDIWESTPSFKIADQTSIATLQIQFVLWGYYAIMSRQPKLLTQVKGTGLIVQSGF